MTDAPSLLTYENDAFTLVRAAPDAVLFPRDQANIVPKISAPVRRFLVNRGDHVKQGQLLAVLENRDLMGGAVASRGQYAQAEANYRTTASASVPEQVTKAQTDVDAARQALDAAKKLLDSREQLFKEGALARKAVDEAQVAYTQSKGQFELAQQNYDRQAELFQKNIIARATLDTFTRNLETAKQSLTGAKAEEEQARLAYSSNIEGVNTTVARLRAELADAQFDLDQTATRAAGPGFVTQVSLRPGMYAIPTQLRTAMLFVNTGERDQELGAAFQQNSLQRVAAGDEAEVAFDAVPGRVFKGRVRGRAAGDLIGAGRAGNANDRRSCPRDTRCHRRHVRLQYPDRFCGPGRDLHPSLASRVLDPQDSAANA